MQLIIDGVSIGGNYGEGEGLTLSYREDAVALKVGADGRHYYAISNDGSATADLNLQWGSPASVSLRAIAATKRPVGFFMRDPATGTEWSTDSCMPSKLPDFAAAAEGSDLVWPLLLGDLEFEPGAF